MNTRTWLAAAATCLMGALTAVEAQEVPRALLGAYAGGHFGAGWGAADWSTSAPSHGGGSSGTIDVGNGYSIASGTGSYFMGFQAGYSVSLAPGILLGLQGDVSAPNLVAGSRSVAFPSPDGPGTLAFQQEWTGTVRGRLGFYHGGLLLYGTGGWSWSWDRLTVSGAAGAPASEQSARVFNSGWVAGIGVEVPLHDGWSAAFELLHADHGRQTASFQGGAKLVSADLTEQSARLALNYNLGLAPGSLQTKGASTSPRLGDWALYGQTTYVHQFAAPFREPYRGTNSLIPRQSRETWDATAYLGYKPWAGGELWFNPEVVQGFGLANTLGLAGFSSGEAYKLGSAYPYARIPRFFLRQTINLGGEDEKVEGAINQFAGTRKTDRLVLTVGKFSASDIFDDNKFAHDPRVDFLNWSLIDTGSWDYAADAWGYTYGAAAEYVKGNWTFAGGAFLLPRFPNSTAIDTSFRQHQYIAEIERRHTLWGQPGEINLTGFLSHARMGRFDEAIRLASILNSAADIAAVRRMQNRTGVAVSIEQNLTADIGAFLRAGMSDGNKEPFAFTDIDRTVAAGLSIGGSAWGRPKDTVGIAGVVNGISRVHERFLDAGGLGILVGDDKLPRPSTERIFETYYSYAYRDWRLTLDYQYVLNPAYNTERGPVSILSTRLRSTF